jgi:hypothetical protein
MDRILERNAALALAGIILIAMACSKGGIVDGESQALGNGSAWCWVDRNPDGVTTALGVCFTESVLSGLPDSNLEATLHLPRGVAVPPYDHVAVAWSPHGHMPDSLFGAPHFDIHFSMVNETERILVQPGPDTVTVPRQFQPHDFFSGVEVVPRMGVHWFDTLGEETHQQPFTKNLIWGFYRGHMTFIEPMVTLDYLRTNPDFSVDIKPPDMFERSGFYPRRYHVRYNPVRKEYTVALEQLTSEQGGARLTR